MNLYPHVYVCATHVCLVPMVVRVRFPETGVIDGGEPVCMCWELELGPLEEHKALWTTGLSL